MRQPQITGPKLPVIHYAGGMHTPPETEAPMPVRLSDEEFRKSILELVLARATTPPNAINGSTA
jgi:hypothetical protein